MPVKQCLLESAARPISPLPIDRNASLIVRGFDAVMVEHNPNIPVSSHETQSDQSRVYMFHHVSMFVIQPSLVPARHSEELFTHGWALLPSLDSKRQDLCIPYYPVVLMIIHPFTHSNTTTSTSTSTIFFIQNLPLKTGFPTTSWRICGRSGVSPINIWPWFLPSGYLT